MSVVMKILSSERSKMDMNELLRKCAKIIEDEVEM